MKEKLKIVAEEVKKKFGNQPFIQTVIDCIENGTALPNKVGWQDYSIIFAFTKDFAEQLFPFYFSTPNRTMGFFNRSGGFPNQVVPAYNYYLKNVGDSKSFLEIVAKTDWGGSFIFKDKYEYKAKFSEDELGPFGKIFKNFAPDDVQVFFDTTRKFETESLYRDRVIRNLNFFHRYFPKLILDNFDQIIRYQRNDSYLMIKGFFKPLSIHRLLELDAKLYAPLIEQKLPKYYDFKLAGWHYLVLSELHKYHPTAENTERFSKFVNDYLDRFTVLVKYPKGDNLKDKKERIKNHPLNYDDIARITTNYTVSRYHWGESVIKHCFLSLKSLAEKDFNTRLEDFCKNTVYVPDDILDVIEQYDGDKMRCLADVMAIKNIDNRAYDFSVKLMEASEDLDWSPYASAIWKYQSKQDFRHQAVVAKILAKKPESVMPLLKNSLTKTKGERALAFLVLGALESKEAKDLLWTSFHNESDDKIRERILPIIVRRFYKEEMSLDEVNKIIASAEKRGAIKAGIKGNVLDFNDLPALYFKDGKQLSSLQVQFLVYRMSQIKIMISDPEAKLLMNHIDKTSSTDFAKAILETFLEKGAVAKQKYIMCLSGILGDESLLDYLKQLFKKLHDDKRLKMAQYVIATIAMIGTDKALRHVEYISRKFKRKASLEAAAIEALENAAEELGMDIFELQDKIIPDFGFDGLYKTIEADGEEIRVFVAKDFKLQYITEDNKIRKSPPKSVSKETKAELKLIQKEIRDVNKAQKERLEQYMVLERRWSREDWEKFYLLNPVMFIYASTLVWGVFDADNQVKQLFYVDEDAALMDIEDDELELVEGKIGIVHPLRMSKEQKSEWNQKFYDLDIAQPFAQLNRPTFFVTDDDKATEIVRYNGKGSEKGARGTQGHFERRGWRKAVSDGGCFDMSKTFKQDGIYAFLNVGGMCIGWYDEDVEFYGITFRKVDYDSWSDSKIKLADVPEIVFSEVIADMEGIVKKSEA